jgi:hypothetical protein
MKNKNPLYVVKGKDVHETHSLIEMMIKKFNLDPLVNIFKNLLTLLLEQVENYALLTVVKNFIDEIIQKMSQITRMMGISTP